MDELENIPEHAVPDCITTSYHEEMIDDNDELLAVGMRFSTWNETRKAIDEFQKKKYCQGQ